MKTEFYEPTFESDEADEVCATMNIEFTEVITEIMDLDCVCALISKEDLKYIFDKKNKTPYNNMGEEDDSYISGEVQFVFDKLTGDLEEILLFPVYEVSDTEISNGEFVDAYDYFSEYEEDARKFKESKEV